jgi:hypothetical protein
VTSPSAISYRMEEQDYVKLNRRLLFMGPFRWLLIALALAIFVNAILSLFLPEDDLTDLFWVAGFGLVVVAVMAFSVSHHAKAVYREQASMSEMRLITLTDQEIHFEQPSGSFKIAWHNIVRWDDWSDMLILYASRASMFVLPKSTIPAEHIDYIRDRLIHSGLPTAGKRRK